MKELLIKIYLNQSITESFYLTEQQNKKKIYFISIYQGVITIKYSNDLMAYCSIYNIKIGL